MRGFCEPPTTKTWEPAPQKATRDQNHSVGANSAEADWPSVNSPLDGRAHVCLGQYMRRGRPNTTVWWGRTMERRPLRDANDRNRSPEGAVSAEKGRHQDFDTHINLPDGSPGSFLLLGGPPIQGGSHTDFVSALPTMTIRTLPMSQCVGNRLARKERNKDMSARGHRPESGFTTERDRLARDTSVMVGGVNHHRLVGAGEWTVNATRDPADLYIFEENLNEWVMAGMTTGRDVIELLNERYAS